MNKSFLYEFFGLPSSRKSITMENGQEIELGKVYTGTGFGSINTNEEHCAECEDDTDEYDVENEYDMDDFISFMKTKMKEKEMYNESTLEEAEYQGRKVQVGRPMRNSGGGKKYVVYVKNPSTGKIKKISFGDVHGGLTAKVSNPKARKAFASRHQCAKKKDRMTAGYWACRINRYGHLWGGKTYGGYW